MSGRDRTRTNATHKTSPAQEPIAVVGMGALFPGAQNLEQYWQTIFYGEDHIKRVPEEYWRPSDFYSKDRRDDRVYTDRGAFIDPIDLDVLAGGVPPANLNSTDASQLLALHVAQQLIKSARLFDKQQELRQRTSVILGISGATQLMSEMSGRLGEPIWRKVLLEAGLQTEHAEELVQRMLEHYVPWQETTFPGLLGNVVAGRIANRLDLHGTNCVVDAACASSLSALSMALSELHLGHSDLVLTGGVDALNHPLMYMCFSQTGALSHSGDCRPFSNQADGTMMGEGVGLLALRRLSDARRDNNAIYALIKGCGSSSDGLSKSVYAPRAEGQSLALQRAYDSAAYAPRTVELLEAHGTATKAGDAAEFTALKTVFTQPNNHDQKEKRQWCALGSVKSQIGHTKGAAGAAGLIKVIMALHHKTLPLTIKAQQENPKLGLANSPFYLNTRTRPWIRSKQHPRRASVSALGFGGSNFHVTLEEYTDPRLRPPLTRQSPVEVVLLEANTTTDLINECHTLAKRCPAATSLSSIAFDTQFAIKTGADAPKLRTAIVAADLESLQHKLARAAALLQDKTESEFEIEVDGIYIGAGIAPQKTAFLFPGQGSQYVNMGADLAMFHYAARQIWDNAADSGPNGQGPHISTFPPPAFDPQIQRRQESYLQQTQQAQPALAAHSLALLELLNLAGLKADAVAGHSFGEIPALCAAGVMEPATAIRIAWHRGSLMQQCAENTPGAMTAVMLDAKQTETILSDVPDCSIANYNSPQQTVISGTVAAIEQAEKYLEQNGAHYIRLPVSSAFHSPIVAGMVEPFSEYLQGMRICKAKIPVVSCSDAKTYPVGANAMRKKLAQQLGKAVYFEQQIQHLYKEGVRNFIEVGPGNVLSKLTHACLQGKPHRCIPLDQKKEHGVTAFFQALARCHAAGLFIHWRHLWQGYQPPEAMQTHTAKSGTPKLTQKVNGTNIGRPYPSSKTAPMHEPLIEKIVTEAATKTVSETVLNERATQCPSQSKETPWTHANEIPSNGPVPTRNLDSKKSTPNDTTAANTLQEMLQLATQAQQSYHESITALQQSMSQAHNNYLHTVSQLLGQTPAPTFLSESHHGTAPPQSETLYSSTLSQVSNTYGQTTQEFQTDGARAHGATPTFTQALESVPALAPTAPEPTLSAMQGTSGADLNPDLIPNSTTQPRPDFSIKDLFYDVVADKTGYPREVLQGDMELEGGLGIDSIKRVEILSEMQSRLPGLEELDASQLAESPTLEQVLSSIEALLETTQTPPVHNMDTDQKSEQGISETVFLQVVAEKTGYPLDVLNLDMDMESGLGIDSIKRVEILSELQTLAPQLGRLESHALSEARTLGQVLQRVLESDNSSEATPSMPTASSISAEPAKTPGLTPLPDLDLDPEPASIRHPEIDLEELFLMSVAEKTGYPREVLRPDMDMESGLGIDSIKRVEILAHMQLQRPELEHLDADKLSNATSLQQLIDVMKSTENGFKQKPEHTNPIEATTESTIDLTEPEPELPRNIPTPIPTDPCHIAVPGLFAEGTILIRPGLGDQETRLGETLNHLLQNRGLRTQLAQKKHDIPEDVIGLIHLGALLPSNDAQHGIEQIQDAFMWLQTLAEPLRQNQGFVVLAQAWHNSNSNNNSNNNNNNNNNNSIPWSCGMTALNRTVAIEWPEVYVRSLDIACQGMTAQHLAELITEELLSGGPESHVMRDSSGGRYTLIDVATPVTQTHTTQPNNKPPTQSVKDGDVIVVSGGARGVTAACLQALTQSHKLRIAILGRTPLAEEPVYCHPLDSEPDLIQALLQHCDRTAPENLTQARQHAKHILATREIRHTLRTLQHHGSEATYFSVDITDTNATRDVLTKIQNQWGSIQGVIHAAGVIADKAIESKTAQQFTHVLNTKLLGLQNLIHSCDMKALRMLYLFSSVASRYGNRGQCDYAAANEVLNRVAQHLSQQHPGCQVKSLMWGAWDGGMVNAALKQHFHKAGVELIPLHKGARAFVQELHCADRQNNVILAPAVSLPPTQANQNQDAPQRQSESKRLYRIALNRRNFPQLRHHAINHNVVIPVAQVVEWFCQIAREELRCPIMLEDVEVLAGIDLRDFKQERFFHIQAGTQGKHCDLRLLDEQHRERYRAHAFADSALKLKSGFGRFDVTQTKWPVSIDKIYHDRALFHGKDFQIIETLEQYGDNGGSVTVNTELERHWAGNSHRNLSSLLEGCLQLTVLWGQCNSHDRALPTSIGRIRWHRHPAPGETFLCQTAIRRSKTQIIADIAAYDTQQRLVLSLEGTRCHFIPFPVNTRKNQPA